MSGSGAFRGSPDLKRNALASVAEPFAPGWLYQSSETQRQTTAAELGLSQGFVALLSITAQAPYMPQRAGAYLAGTLDAVTPGSDTDAIVNDWMIDRWSGEHGIESRLREGPTKEAAARVIELVRRRSDEQLDRSAWRAVRNGLNTVDTPDADDREYAKVVAAMAWDPRTSPEVGRDVVVAWRQAMLAVHGNAAGWDQAQQQEMIDRIRIAQRAVQEKAGDMPQDAESLKAWTERFEKLTADRLADEGIGERFRAIEAYWKSLKEYGTSVDDELRASITACAARRR